MIRKSLFPALTLAGLLAVTPSVAVAGGSGLVLDVPVAGCGSSSWLQVTTPDGVGEYELGGDSLRIVSGVIGDGVDHRFTVQTDKPVDGCHVTGAGVLTLDGDVLDPYQRDVAPGGANLQVTWRGEESGEEPEDVPLTPLEPADPVDPGDEVPLTPLEPADPIEEPGDDVPLIPLEPAEPVEPEVPGDEVPLTPLEPADPIEKPDGPTTGEVVTDETTEPVVTEEPAEETPAPVKTNPRTVG